MSAEQAGTVVMEPSRATPVVAEADVCVLGGSCTGVFAAVRAARLGARVALVEQTNAFGGVATNGLVNIWHSHMDTEGKRQIIAGLTIEVVERLRKRDACSTWKVGQPDAGVHLNTEELKIELDELVAEARVRAFLHTHCVGAQTEDGRVGAVFVENKNGRGAIRARAFVDATGDGDLARWAGIPFTVSPHLQPATSCAKIRGLNGLKIRELYNAHREEFGLPEDAGWNGEIPNVPDVRMYAETHAFGMNCADADQLTRAELDERRRIRAIMDMVRKYHPERRADLCLLALAAHIGIRETRRFEAAYRLTEMDVLEGVRFDDAIANGSYRVDVHHPSGGGFLFKYLDGSQINITARGREPGRWRAERTVNPTFYQIPYRCLIHPSAKNVLMAGRMIAADTPAYGAIRVMVNLNQTGEAAGVAAALAARGDGVVSAVPPADLRATLASGGSAML